MAKVNEDGVGDGRGQEAAQAPDAKQRSSEAFLTPAGKPCAEHKTFPDPDEPCWPCEHRAEDFQARFGEQPPPHLAPLIPTLKDLEKPLTPAEKAYGKLVAERLERESGSLHLRTKEPLVDDIEEAREEARAAGIMVKPEDYLERLAAARAQRANEASIVDAGPYCQHGFREATCFVESCRARHRTDSARKADRVAESIGTVTEIFDNGRVRVVWADGSESTEDELWRATRTGSAESSKEVQEPQAVALAMLDAAAGDMPQPWRDVTLELLRDALTNTPFAMLCKEDVVREPRNFRRPFPFPNAGSWARSKENSPIKFGPSQIVQRIETQVKVRIGERRHAWIRLEFIEEVDQPK